MDNFIINFFTEKMAKSMNYQKGSDQYEVLKYNFSALYYDISKTIALLLTALCLKISKGIIFYLIIYGVIRHMGRGLHLKSNRACAVTGYLQYLGGYYIAKYLVLPTFVTPIIMCLVTILNAIYAPSPTKQKPFSAKRKVIYKYLTIIVLIIYSVYACAYANNFQKNIILIAVILDSVYTRSGEYSTPQCYTTNVNGC